MTFNFKAIWVILILTIGLGTPVLSEVAKVNIDKFGVAIEGYDPVAYFEKSQPVKGLTKYRATHDGATYQFASSHHKAQLENNPAKYVPEYGGYCVFGMR